jgi:hypothetical protein
MAPDPLPTPSAREGGPGLNMCAQRLLVSSRPPEQIGRGDWTSTEGDYFRRLHVWRGTEPAGLRSAVLGLPARTKTAMRISGTA